MVPYNYYVVVTPKGSISLYCEKTFKLINFGVNYDVNIWLPYIEF